jgi:YgiT-type zinc finger domain-containing protein
MIRITVCPTCGSRRIRRTCRNLTRDFRGKAYIVPALRFHECPDCGEKVFDRDAMRKIEAYSPAYDKVHAGK